MLLEHRVGDFADLDGDLRALDRDDGDVLLGSRVGRVGDKLGHLRAAADDARALLDEIHDDVAAIGAGIELHDVLLFPAHMGLSWVPRNSAPGNRTDVAESVRGWNPCVSFANLSRSLSLVFRRAHM